MGLKYFTYLCLNRHCKHEFTMSGEPRFCPNCGGSGGFQNVPGTKAVGPHITSRRKRVEHALETAVNRYNETQDLPGLKITGFQKPYAGERTAKFAFEQKPKTKLPPLYERDAGEAVRLAAQINRPTIAAPELMPEGGKCTIAEGMTIERAVEKQR